MALQESLHCVYAEADTTIDHDLFHLLFVISSLCLSHPPLTMRRWWSYRFCALVQAERDNQVVHRRRQQTADLRGSCYCVDCAQ